MPASRVTAIRATVVIASPNLKSRRIVSFGTVLTLQTFRLPCGSKVLAPRVRTDFEL